MEVVDFERIDWDLIMENDKFIRVGQPQYVPGTFIQHIRVQAFNPQQGDRQFEGVNSGLIQHPEIFKMLDALAHLEPRHMAPLAVDGMEAKIR